MSILNDLITDVMVDSCLIDLEDFAGIKMTKVQMRDLLSDQDPFVATLVGYYGKETVASGLDTQDRDELFDIFAKKILGRAGWPMIRDHDRAALSDDIHRAVRQGKIEAFDA